MLYTPIMTNIALFKDNKLNKIAELLDKGFAIDVVANRCSCSPNDVLAVIKTSQFQQWQKELAVAELNGIGARTAIQTLIEVAKNKRNSAQARVSASDKLLSYTGYQVGANGQISKSPSTMTQSELQAKLEELEREASNRAKPTIISGEAIEHNESLVDELLK